MRRLWKAAAGVNWINKKQFMRHIKTALEQSALSCDVHACRYVPRLWRQHTPANINAAPTSVNSHKSANWQWHFTYIKRETALDLCPHASSFDLHVIGPLFRNVAPCSDSDSHSNNDSGGGVRARVIYVALGEMRTKVWVPYASVRRCFRKLKTRVNMMVKINILLCVHAAGKGCSLEWPMERSGIPAMCLLSQAERYYCECIIFSLLWFLTHSQTPGVPPGVPSNNFCFTVCSM
jgi:hypothetical protein